MGLNLCLVFPRDKFQAIPDRDLELSSQYHKLRWYPGFGVVPGADSELYLTPQQWRQEGQVPLGGQPRIDCPTLDEVYAVIARSTVYSTENLRDTTRDFGGKGVSHMKHLPLVPLQLGRAGRKSIHHHYSTHFVRKIDAVESEN